MFIEDVKLYQLSDQALAEYRANVKKCSNVSHGQAVLKLARNIKLAHSDRSGLKIIHKYGYLHIHTKFNQIVKIENFQKPSEGWYKDVEEYERLSELLGV